MKGAGPDGAEGVATALAILLRGEEWLASPLRLAAGAREGAPP